MDSLKDLSDYIVVLEGKENVGTSLKEVPAGLYNYKDSTIVVKENMKSGFKIALIDIKKGEPVIKYGFEIGRATTNINQGEIVHTHNIKGAI